MNNSKRPWEDPKFDDDNPEWTEEDFARAKPAAEVLPPEVLAAFGKGKPGRPALDKDTRKQAISIRLSPDVLEALRASGPGWQTRADDILRKGLHLAKR